MEEPPIISVLQRSLDYVPRIVPILPAGKKSSFDENSRYAMK
jgi:hypothetical protein